MKKLFLFAVMMSFVLGFAGMGIGETQTIDGGVPEHIDFTLTTTTLHYGNIIPGQESDVQSTFLNVKDDNNVNFDVDVALTLDDISGIFSNIYLESTTVLDTFTDKFVLNVPFKRLVPDTSVGVAFDFRIKSRLKVPVTFGPVSGATGTVTYTISVPQT